MAIPQAWLDVLKILLGVPPADTSKDAAIDFYAGIALQMIAVRTGRTFVHGRYVDRMGGPQRTVWLTEYPVEAVEQVTQGDAVLPPEWYRVTLPRGEIEFALHCCNRAVYDPCCELPFEVTYTANADLPPDWVSLVVSDAVRAGLAMADAGNAYGFVAKKVAVTDVGSVELGGAGDSPASAMTATIDTSLDAWLGPVFAASSSCCQGGQSSTLIDNLTPPAAARKAA